MTSATVANNGRINHRVACHWPLVFAAYVSAGCAQVAAAPVRVWQENGVTHVEGTEAHFAALPQHKIEVGVELSARARPDSSGFLRVNGGLLLPDGRIAVANSGSYEVEIFDSAGVFITSHGGFGRGPLQYQALQLIAGADPTLLVTVDARQRVSKVFDSRGGPIVRAIVPFRMQPVFRFADGSWLSRVWGPLPKPTTAGIVRTQTRVVRNRDAEIVSDFGWHDGDDVAWRSGPRGPEGGKVPFGRELLVGGRDSVIVIAPTGPYEFKLFSAAGKLTHAIRIDVERTRLSATFKRRFRDSVLTNFGRDPYGRREWTILSADDVLPTEFPAFERVVVSQDNTVWIRDYSATRTLPTSWTVFSSSGLPLFRVLMPARCEILDVSAGRILAVTRDSNDVEHVHVFSFSDTLRAARVVARTGP